MSTAGRILFIAPSAYPLGGVQTWLDYLLPGLSSAGWSPVLGLVSGRFHDVARYTDVHPGLDPVAIGNPTGSREGRVRALMDVVRSVKPRIVVPVNICDCYPAIGRMRAAGDAAPQVVMADHSVEPSYLQDARAWRQVLDGFVGTNRLTLELARAYAGLEPSRVHYAPYGVPIPALPAGGREPAAPLRIGYSGRVDEFQKRAQDIPGILGHLDQMGVDYQFRLAGAGPYLETLVQRLAPQIDNGKVQILGMLDPAALDDQLYGWGDVLLVTSFWETGPIVIWEAMARGMAVASSRYVGCGLEGSLKDGDNCLLYPAGDVQAAASQLRRLADNEGLRTRLKIAGGSLVRERYGREQSVAAWDGCLRSVAAAPALPPAGPAAASGPSGRLDRWLGAERGETLRRWLAREHAHESAGGEWPHTEHPQAGEDDGSFWKMAEGMDQP